MAYQSWYEFWTRAHERARARADLRIPHFFNCRRRRRRSSREEPAMTRTHCAFTTLTVGLWPAQDEFSAPWSEVSARIEIACRAHGLLVVVADRWDSCTLQRVVVSMVTLPPASPVARPSLSALQFSLSVSIGISRAAAAAAHCLSVRGGAWLFVWM
ncbi:hypothetical protein Y032_0325g2548 [Ancylostoma ceylanicum]|uniref:Uncharacterized protein n=1 Tax=Ancylostoma ceylanicum TaxID=53326 RepID=A0A016S149_9BILA|nr:hypothetical protein Y032_0325g2548 [Ancylostoma ceylanicum]